MANPHEQVTPKLDQLTSPEQCRDALKIGENALVESNIFEVLAQVGKELEDRDEGLHVKLRVVGPDLSAVEEVASAHARFTQGLAIEDVGHDSDIGKTPRIRLEIGNRGSRVLSRGIEAHLALARPFVSIDATPLDLQFTFHEESGGNVLRDFPHGIWEREPGKRMLDETKLKIISSFLGEPPPIAVLQ